MNIQTETAIANNGVNLEALMGAREALTQAPQAAEFTWRAQCDWIEGTYSKSSINGFFGLGRSRESRRLCVRRGR